MNFNLPLPFAGVRRLSKHPEDGNSVTKSSIFGKWEKFFHCKEMHLSERFSLVVSAALKIDHPFDWLILKFSTTESFEWQFDGF